MKTITTLSLLSHALFATGCMTEAERRGATLLHRQLDSSFTNNGTIPVATGDRFNNGTLTPRGVGSQPGSVNFSSIYNVVELKSATLGLVKEFNLTYFETPYKTSENSTMYGFKLPSSSGKYTVLLEAGVHARERGGPDHLINFISDLLWAEREKTGLVYGGMSYTAAEVRTALSLGIVIIPLVNPDGVAYDHATNSCWRKNRNTTSATAGNGSTVGVDLNRNFAPLWDFKKGLADTGEYVAASEDPGDLGFHGLSPLSEAESRNVDWTMRQMPDLGWFIDLHSMASLVLYAWGHDTNQVKDPDMNLLNPKYDGKRGVIPDNTTMGWVYSEYIDQKVLDVLTLTAARVADGMISSTGRGYVAITSSTLYPTTGTASDHLAYLALKDPKRRNNGPGLTIEFGRPNEEAECIFYPTVKNHRKSMIETGAGYMEYLLSAARFS